MKLSIEVTLGSEAMSAAGDAAEAIFRALMHQAADPTFGKLRVGEEGQISDYNGSTVGTWKVVEDASG